MAGATSTGLSVASSTVAARSSARPAAMLRQQIGRRRRDHQQVGGARELDVAHLAFVGERKEVGVDLDSLSACNESGVTNWAAAR